MRDAFLGVHIIEIGVHIVVAAFAAEAGTRSSSNTSSERGPAATAQRNSTSCGRSEHGRRSTLYVYRSNVHACAQSGEKREEARRKDEADADVAENLRFQNPEIQQSKDFGNLFACF